MSANEHEHSGTGLAADGARAPFPLPHLTRGIALWWCELGYGGVEIDELAGCLSPAEHARAARFGTHELRRRWIAGRATLRRILAASLGAVPADVPIQRGRRGRPELAPDTARIDFNVSHTRGVALIAVARDLPDGARIGVDIERVDRDVGADKLARKFLTVNERATLEGRTADARRRRFLHYWTCKEAMSKATGDGLAAPFGRLDVELDVELDASPRLVAGPAPYEPARWTLHTPATPNDYLATLAVWQGP